MTLTLGDLKNRERQEVTVHPRMLRQHRPALLHGGIGNATWAGTPLAPLLEEAGVAEAGREVVFWGADAGEQTWGEITVTEQFARSMALEDAMNPDNLLVYEMNGEPLPQLNGYPVRLISPGWYGIANVKWLTRIEVMDRPTRATSWPASTSPSGKKSGMGRRPGPSPPSPDRLKSAPAKVTKQGDEYQIMGAAWGAPIAGVEVQIDEGPWQAGDPDRGCGGRVRLELLDPELGRPDPGEHTITSRAIAENGEVQPAPDDPLLAGKRPTGRAMADHSAREHYLTQVAGAHHRPGHSSQRPCVQELVGWK